MCLNGAMKAGVLYFLTALVTGLYNFYRLMEIVNGAPVPLLPCVGLLGSVMLLAAAVLAPFRARSAGKLGLAGSILSWVFYAPLLVAAALTPYTFWISIQSNFSFREYIPLLGILLGPALLIVCTITSVLFSRRHHQSADVVAS